MTVIHRLSNHHRRRNIRLHIRHGSEIPQDTDDSAFLLHRLERPAAETDGGGLAWDVEIVLEGDWEALNDRLTLGRTGFKGGVLDKAYMERPDCLPSLLEVLVEFLCMSDGFVKLHQPCQSQRRIFVWLIDVPSQQSSNSSTPQFTKSANFLSNLPTTFDSLTTW